MATELTLARPGGHVALRDYGGDGADVLLLHGGGANLESWGAVVPALAEDVRVVAMDLTGHGRSWLPAELWWKDLVSDVGLVHDALPLERPLVVGQSLGGGVALEHAARHGACAGVFCVDGAAWRRRGEARTHEYDPDELRAEGYGWRGTEAELEVEVAKVRAEYAQTAVAPGLDAVEAQFRRNHLRQPDGTLLRIPTVEQVVSYARVPDRENSTPFPKIYEAIECPVFLLMATEGIPGLAERARLDDLPAHVTVEWIEGGHCLECERPHDVAGRIRAFAASL